VDLEGARTGEPKILELLKRIVEVGLPVEVGGGMRLMANIDDALAAGAARVSIGTRAATDSAFARNAITTFRERLVIDIAAKDGLVMVQGWRHFTELQAIDLAKEMEQLGAERILFTDVARDGMLEGPNYAALEAMVAALEIPVIASGGITNIADVRRTKRTGAEACIIGRALYTGTIKLPAALAAARE
jgi:phosphoribosylformimino-5-aminoimidazole carboxamide ribotide isomerase